MEAQDVEESPSISSQLDRVLCRIMDRRVMEILSLYQDPTHNRLRRINLTLLDEVRTYYSMLMDITEESEDNEAYIEHEKLLERAIEDFENDSYLINSEHAYASIISMLTMIKKVLKNIEDPNVKNSLRKLKKAITLADEHRTERVVESNFNKIVYLVILYSLLQSVDPSLESCNHYIINVVDEIIEEELIDFDYESIDPYINIFRKRVYISDSTGLLRIFDSIVDSIYDWITSSDPSEKSTIEINRLIELRRKI
jgi:hypothetical protein